MHITLQLPACFVEFCRYRNTTPDAVLRGFIADLHCLRTQDYCTNGSDERQLADAYFDRTWPDRGGE